MEGVMFHTELSGKSVFSDHRVSRFLLNTGTYQERYMTLHLTVSWSSDRDIFNLYL